MQIAEQVKLFKMALRYCSSCMLMRTRSDRPRLFTDLFILLRPANGTVTSKPNQLIIKKWRSAPPRTLLIPPTQALCYYKTVRFRFPVKFQSRYCRISTDGLIENVRLWALYNINTNAACMVDLVKLKENFLTKGDS